MKTLGSKPSYNKSSKSWIKEIKNLRNLQSGFSKLLPNQMLVMQELLDQKQLAL